MRRLALLVFLILVATTYLVGCGDVTYAQPTETETPDSVAATEEEKEPTEFALHDLEQHTHQQNLVLCDVLNHEFQDHEKSYVF